jgi:hypothetical protein
MPRKTTAMTAPDKRADEPHSPATMRPTIDPMTAMVSAGCRCRPESA